MDGLRDDMIFDAGRISYGDGKGAIADVAADSHSSSSITVSNKYSAPGQPGARFVQEGAEYNFDLVASATSPLNTATVISVSIAQNSGSTTDTITISQTAINVSSTHYVFRRAAGGNGIEPKGLRALVDDITATGLFAGPYFSASSFNNIDRSLYGKWNANVLHNCSTGRVIDSKLIQKAFSLVKKESGKDINMIAAEYFVVDQFLDHVNDDRRYATNSFDAGVSSLSYNGIPLVRDLLAPYNEMFLFTKDALKKYTLKDYGFAQEDGRIMRQIANYDEWEGFMKAYLNFGCEQPKATAVIRDLLDE